MAKEKGWVDVVLKLRGEGRTGKEGDYYRVPKNQKAESNQKLH